MGRRYWNGRRRDREGLEGAGCWYCMREDQKKMILQERDDDLDYREQVDEWASSTSTP